MNRFYSPLCTLLWFLMPLAVYAAEPAPTTSEAGKIIGWIAAILIGVLILNKIFKK